MSILIDPDRITRVGLDAIYTRNQLRDILVEVLRAANGHVPTSTIKYEIGVIHDRLDKNQLY